MNVFMAYTFFIISITAAAGLFYWEQQWGRLHEKYWMVGAAGLVWSLVFEYYFGGRQHLYFYIAPHISPLFMLIASVLLYPLLDMVYAIHLPSGRMARIGYTAIWLAAMILFEYASVFTKTIVFTGWKMFPWSYATYLATFAWIMGICHYYDRKIKVKRDF